MEELKTKDLITVFLGVAWVCFSGDFLFLVFLKGLLGIFFFFFSGVLKQILGWFILLFIVFVFSETIEGTSCDIKQKTSIQKHLGRSSASRVFSRTPSTGLFEFATEGPMSQWVPFHVWQGGHRLACLVCLRRWPFADSLHTYNQHPNIATERPVHFKWDHYKYSPIEILVWRSTRPTKPNIKECLFTLFKKKMARRTS